MVLTLLAARPALSRLAQPVTDGTSRTWQTYLDDDDRGIWVNVALSVCFTTLHSR